MSEYIPTEEEYRGIMKEPPHQCYSIDHLIDQLEALRSDIIEIRKWGNQWKERCLKLETNHGEVNEQNV